jgi:hypothetical protein
MALFLLGAHNLRAYNPVRTGAVFPEGAAMLAKVLADAWGIYLMRTDEVSALPAVALITFNATELHASPQNKKARMREHADL